MKGTRKYGRNEVGRNSEGNKEVWEEGGRKA